jgi:hypothetical protein
MYVRLIISELILKENRPESLIRQGKRRRNHIYYHYEVQPVNGLQRNDLLIVRILRDTYRKIHYVGDIKSSFAIKLGGIYSSHFDFKA